MRLRLIHMSLRSKSYYEDLVQARQDKATQERQQQLKELRELRAQRQAHDSELQALAEKRRALEERARREDAEAA